MVIEKSGLYVFIKPKEKKVVAYDKSGNEVGTIRLYNREWEVSTESKGN